MRAVDMGAANVITIVMASRGDWVWTRQGLALFGGREKNEEEENRGGAPKM